MKFFFWIWICFAGTLAGAQDFLSCHVVSGWEQAGAARDFTADNLYQYKDGAAEGYLIYSFARMKGVDCEAGDLTLAIDVSDMTDADSAYGMFSANRDPKEPIEQMGMGGQVLAQNLMFAKGRYYVEITVIRGSLDSDQSKVLRAFAAKIEKLIDGRDSAPEALGWFAPEGQVSVRLVPQSVLGLRVLKRGYVAKYEHGQAFIVTEESPEAAAEVMKKLRMRFEGAVAAQIGDEAFEARDRYLESVCVFRKGRYIAGYTNLADAQTAAALAAKLALRIP